MMMNFKLDAAKCLRCGACIADCPVGVLAADGEGQPYVPDGNERFCIDCRHCLAVCPAGAVSLGDKHPEEAFAPATIPRKDEMLALLRQRRSIRRFHAEALDRDTLDTLENALDCAPTGCNDRRMVFTVIESAEAMEQFRTKCSGLLKLLMKSGIPRLFYPQITRFFDSINRGEDLICRGAPHLIAALVPRNAPCAHDDPVIALAQFELLAQPLGVGTCWCGFAAHMIALHPGLKKLVRMPRGYRVGGVLLFGRPAVRYYRSNVPSPFAKNRI